MYRLKQRINNNVILASNELHQVILVGKGIGFQKKRGDIIKESTVENRYFESENLHFEHIISLFDFVNDTQFDCLKQIVTQVEKTFTSKINPNLLFSLLDHIVNAIQRLKEDKVIVLPIEWEIKKYYPTEYHLAKLDLAKINQTFDVELPTSEIVMIAIHFINAQNEAQANNEIIEVIELTTKIVKIVNYHFNIHFREESTMYQRFITHIKYYLMRQQRNEQLVGDDSLVQIFENKYPEEAQCVKKIVTLIENETEYQVSETEQMYLILHVGNLVRTI